MAAKYAQRRNAEGIAHEIKVDARLVISELRCLERLGYVHCWSDGRWGLTSKGNMRRNELTVETDAYSSRSVNPPIPLR
jgi:Mn-dependent DtxR family transcriptional regulator